MVYKPLHVLPLLLLCLLMPVGGCGPLVPRKAQPVDLSSPKSAALAYLKAIQRGDAATARAAAVGTEEELRWVDSIANMVDGMRVFDKALLARFSRVGYQIQVDLHESLRTLADEPVELIDQGTVEQADTAARIKPKLAGFTSHYQIPVVLALVKGQWKVDVEGTYIPAPSGQELLENSDADRKQRLAAVRKELSASFAKFQQSADVFHDMAKDVKRGKFASIPEAEKALAERMARMAGKGK